MEISVRLFFACLICVVNIAWLIAGIFIFTGKLKNARNKKEPSGVDKDLHHVSCRMFKKELKDIIDKGCQKDYAVLFIRISEMKRLYELFGKEILEAAMTDYKKYINTLCPNILAYMEFNGEGSWICIKKECLSIEDMLKISSYLFIRDTNIYNLGIRLGVYNIESSDASVDSIMRRAMTAEQFVSEDCLFPYQVYGKDMHEKMMSEYYIISQMKKALADGEFQVYLQPIYNAETEEIASAEALIRWISPTKGFMSPGEFIPVLEKHGFVTELDLFVVNKVAEIQKLRMAEGKKIVPISVNLSGKDFRMDNLREVIDSIIERNGVPKSCISLEITESVYVDWNKKNMDLVKGFMSDGIEVSIDDFGSGYASLCSISKYKPQVIKLDMSLIRMMDSNEHALRIIKSTISMAHEINMKVVAEGVEMQEQARTLREAGCDFIQGYYYSKVLKENEFKNLIDQAA